MLEIGRVDQVRLVAPKILSEDMYGTDYGRFAETFRIQWRMQRRGYPGQRKVTAIFFLIDYERL